MDIEELNKAQIVLLTLLVSFVTSIATGIVTVSLMQQAPPAIAQTVNRIVERTVEKVVPQSQGASAASAAVVEKTVVMHDSDRITAAIATARTSVVRIYENEATTSPFLAMGVILDEHGNIATDAGALGERATVSIARPDGTRTRADVVARVEGSGIATLQPTSSDAGTLSWRAAVFGDAPILGESVLALSGESSTHVGQGLVASLEGVIDTDVAPSAIVPGSILVDLDGGFLGISTTISRKSSAASFVPLRSTVVDAPKTE